MISINGSILNQWFRGWVRVGSVFSFADTALVELENHGLSCDDLPAIGKITTSLLRDAFLHRMHLLEMATPNMIAQSIQSICEIRRAGVNKHKSFIFSNRRIFAGVPQLSLAHAAFLNMFARKIRTSTSSHNPIDYSIQVVMGGRMGAIQLPDHGQKWGFEFPVSVLLQGMHISNIQCVVHGHRQQSRVV